MLENSPSGLFWSVLFFIVSCFANLLIQIYVAYLNFASFLQTFFNLFSKYFFRTFESH